MNLECSQMVLNVSDVPKARDFYIGQLELPVVEEHPRSFAFQAGAVRFNVTRGGVKVDEESGVNAPVTMMLHMTELDADVAALRAKGVCFLGEIENLPGIMRHIALLDPDNNMVYLAERVRDPLL